MKLLRHAALAAALLMAGPTFAADVSMANGAVTFSTPGRRYESTSPSPRNMAAFMTLNAAVAMPRPSDSPTIVISRIAGCRANSRAACLRSRRASRRKAMFPYNAAAAHWFAGRNVRCVT